MCIGLSYKLQFNYTFRSFGLLHTHRVFDTLFRYLFLFQLIVIIFSPPNTRDSVVKCNLYTNDYVYSPSLQIAEVITFFDTAR